MNPESHRKSILRIARSGGIHPGLALRCLEVSTVLHNHLQSGDRLIWLSDEGGAAWEALSVKAGKKTENLKRIFCVFVDPTPHTPAFWLEIEELLGNQNIEFFPVFIVSDSTSPLNQSPASRLSEDKSNSDERENPGADTAASPSSGLIGKLIAFLGKSERRSNPAEKNSFRGDIVEKDRELLSDQQPGEAKASLSLDSCKVGEDADEILSLGTFHIQPAVFPASSAIGLPVKKYLRKESRESVFFLPESVDIRERFKAAEVLFTAGLLPVIDICSREAHQAAAWAAGRWEGGTGRSVLSCKGDLRDAAAFLAIPEFPVLSPASMPDLQGALDWLKDSGTSAFILDPGEAGLPSAAALKAPWEKGKAVLVKESSKGSAGRILCITPGLLTREVRKAADRLVRDNISVKLLSMRFLSTVDLESLEAHIQDEDVILIAEAGPSIGGLRSNAGIGLMRRGRSNVVFAESVHEARSLAEEAAGILRAMRIQRTVDDVRADRWR